MKMRSLVLGLALAGPAFSAAQGQVTCRARVPQGTDLVFRIAETISDGTRGGGLFGGVGQGIVTVKPVAPLKIQYPVRFPVSSYWSKAFAINIFSGDDESGGFSFHLTANRGAGEGGSFPATIQYGRKNSRYSAVCH